jgi:pyridinium-3,5-bisthiocarboxylic acid mononucleotide nickel chelatase
MSEGQRTLWLDVSAGVAGDMVLGALLDAGASVEFVQAQLDAVLAGAMLTVAPVTRAGMRASKVEVSVTEQDPPRRTWRQIEKLLHRADLDDETRASAVAVFQRLALAEARVHGISPDDVHFHEVGAMDSIADVVGSCAALNALGVTDIVAGPIALGSGTVNTEHGVLPVPVPAVLQLVTGWTVLAGGPGEVATPTGVALITALADASGPLPAMRVDSVGVGAGTRDTPGRANVVRAVVGVAQATRIGGASRVSIVEANVDDLDPRLWPGVLTALLDAGAHDAWLTPILMKKGRPAHTVHAMGRTEDVAALQAVLLTWTSTFGVRSYEVDKCALPRTWETVEVAGHAIRIKIAYSDGVIRQATPEFSDAEMVAEQLGLPVRDVLGLAAAAATGAGLTPDRPFPSRTQPSVPSA